MKSVNPKIYSKDYYLKSCYGFEEFAKSHGNITPERTKLLLSQIALKPGMKLLDIGCGRGDVIIYSGKKKIDSFGIDYAKDAISLAKKSAGKQKEYKKYMHFSVGNAKTIPFPNNFFDAVVSIDVFEHLYKDELETSMKEISRVLKSNGTLLVHTEPNIIYLNFWHKWYIYPVSQALIKINKHLSGKEYPGLPKDPRNDLHKTQHVNEPTIFYLQNLFKRYEFKGSIKENVSLLKKVLSWKDLLYNIIVLWYPLCNVPPFSWFFAYDYTAVMTNKKRH